MKSIFTLICVFITGFSLPSLSQLPTGIISGPSTGSVELRSAHVWLQVGADVKTLSVQYWKKNDEQKTKSIFYRGELGNEFNYVKIQLTSLEPNTTYQYHFVVDGRINTASKSEFTTQDLWQYRKPPPDFTFLAGSCAYFNEPKYDRPGKPYGNDSSIFLSMAKEKAAFMLWLGDNWYTREVDYFSEWGLGYRASRDRSLPVLQPFWKSMSHYAIWDDHDYGPNNSDKSFVFKDASRKVFMNNWANPSFGENGQGIYTKFTYNDVDFFLLDDRWFRSNDETPANIKGTSNANKKMYGDQQMEWFKNAMRQSQDNTSINFRIIATGSQVLNPLSPKDCFRHYPAEFNEMMDFLDKEKINGVVFLTGDRHLSEINKLERLSNYPLYDVTASPLTAGFAPYNSLEKNSTSRVFSLENKQNYAHITVQGAGAERKLSVEFKGLKGEKLGEWQLSLKDLTSQ